jgi:hypothetical protein
MAQLFDIKKVVVGPRTLTATVEVAPSAPLYTSEDLEGTTRIWQLMPQLRDHVCLGDSAPHFGDVMGDTELAHLLEHVTVELLARTDIAGDITSGQTAEVGERTYEVSISCVDDVLVTGALSSAAWVMQWAFSGGGEPAPDIDAITSGLVELVDSLPHVEESDPTPDPEPADADEAELESAPEVEPEPEADEPFDPEGVVSGEGDLVATREASDEQSEERGADEVTLAADDVPEPDVPAETEVPLAPEPETPASTFETWDMGDMPRSRPVR